MRRFNPEKELKKIQHGSRNKIIFGVLLLLIIIAIGSSYALYQVRYSKRIIYTKVAPFNDHDIELAVYVNGKKENEFPTKESGYFFTDIECENNEPRYVNAAWDYDRWALSVLAKGPNKCNVYFDTKGFAYTNDHQYYEYTVEKTGNYKIELWGAGGGMPPVLLGKNGLGGYTSGVIHLDEGTKLYFYLGEKGKKGELGANKLSGATFNGGGSGISDGGDGGGSGGGATDVRLVKGKTWDDFDSLKSRIMVAGGGSGGPTLELAVRNSSGGGLTGVGDSYYYINYANSANNQGTSLNATQTSGNKFGIGGQGTVGVEGGSGGGGGYYGGKADNVHHGGAGGGSSFISGHLGCDAISENSTEDEIEHTGRPNHYSNYVFTNTVMIDGEGYYWTNKRGGYVGVPGFNTNGTMDGNDDNGYAKITYLKEYQTEDIEEFNFAAYAQEYKVPKTGKYKIELWGAGGGMPATGLGLNGFGGYTSGELELNKDTILYFYVGGKGAKCTLGANKLSGESFNGGGSGISDGGDGGGSGGGATDVRLVKGETWDDFDSLKSRIMVASGGSGAPVLSNVARNSSGGGLTGVGDSYYYQFANQGTSLNATQTSGNKFGIGGQGTIGAEGGSGGGGGYYGGKADNVHHGGAGGGSSFISGHLGCNAISKESTVDKIEHTGSPNHYSNYIFSNTVMIDGLGHEWVTDTQGDYVGMPTIYGEGTMDGNDGDGFARITYIGPKS